MISTDGTMKKWLERHAQPANSNKTIAEREKEQWEKFNKWLHSEQDNIFYFIEFDEVPPHMRGMV